MPFVSGIYAIRNTVTGDFYIGSSVRLHKRRTQHWRELDKGTHRNRRLLNAWRKYGAAAFEWVVIAEIERDDLVATEQRLLDRLVTLPCCYNISIDAQCATRGRSVSVETRARIRAKNKGTKPSALAIARTKELRTGQKQSEELVRSRVAGFKRAVAEKGHGGKGVPKDPAVVARRTATWKARLDGFRHLYEGRTPPNKGKKASAETIEKLRVSHLGQQAWNKGVPPTSTAIARAVATRKRNKEQRIADGTYVSGPGRTTPHTDETKAKLREIQARNLEDPAFREKVRAGKAHQIATVGAPRGWKQRPESVAKRAAALRGKTRTPEQRARMSAGMREARRRRRENP